MEMRILLFGIALPSFVGAAFGIWFIRRKQAGGLDCFVGIALASALFLSAISEESLIHFAVLNRWLWFPLSILVCASIVALGAFFTNSPGARTLVVLTSTISAAVLLNIPSWEILINRLFLGVGAATSAILLAQVVKRRKNISTYLALSLSLVGLSVLTMLSGFAKLAIPIGAVSVCLGIISVVHIAIQSQSLHRGVDLSGAVVIAACADLAAAVACAVVDIGPCLSRLYITLAAGAAVTCGCMILALISCWLCWHLPWCSRSLSVLLVSRALGEGASLLFVSIPCFSIQLAWRLASSSSIIPFSFPKQI